MACKLDIIAEAAKEDVFVRNVFGAARARVISSLGQQGFSRVAGRVSLVNPRGIVGLIRSVPRRIPPLCSSSAGQKKAKVM